MVLREIIIYLKDKKFRETNILFEKNEFRIKKKT
jgi:hypothetical protein